jgi:3-oxoacyl-[acyl-carrier-protein] synthase II
MGEGAAALVLENAETARARGALPLARLAGWQLACDPASPLELDPSADPVLGCANAALRRSGLKPGEVDYVNAHGTGTRLNDRVESLALRKLFGSAGGPWVSSTKGATGHLLGAAAAVEAVLCVKALQEGWAPPTVGLKNPDLDCALQHVPPGGIQGSFRNVISLNYGLGGHLATLVFSKP